MKLFTDNITSEMAQVIKDLCQDDFFNKFRLIGGTALALQIGHRKSVDIDFFAGKSGLSEDEMRKHLVQKYNYRELRADGFGMLGEIKEIKVDVFDYGVPFAEKAIEFEGYRLASPIDIGAMKLDAGTRRNTWKDLMDIYVISGNYSLENLLQAYEIKYPNRDIKIPLVHLQKNIDAPKRDLFDDIEININFAHLTENSIKMGLEKLIGQYLSQKTQQKKDIDFGENIDFGI